MSLASQIAKELTMHAKAGSWREVDVTFWSKHATNAIIIREDLLELVMERIIKRHLDSSELSEPEKALVGKSRTKRVYDELVEILSGDSYGYSVSDARELAAQYPDGTLEERLIKVMTHRGKALCE